MEQDKIQLEIHYICEKHQEERPSGLVYVTETGYRKVSKLLGFDYKKLTHKQRKQFKIDCKDSSMGSIGSVKNYEYYLSL